MQSRRPPFDWRNKEKQGERDSPGWRVHTFKKIYNFHERMLQLTRRISHVPKHVHFVLKLLKEKREEKMSISFLTLVMFVIFLSH